MNQQSEAGADISSCRMKDELRQIKKNKKKEGNGTLPLYGSLVLLFSISFALSFFSLFFISPGKCS